MAKAEKTKVKDEDMNNAASSEKEEKAAENKDPEAEMEISQTQSEEEGEVDVQTGEGEQDKRDGEKGEEKEEEEQSGNREGNIKESEEYKALNEKYLRLYAEFDNYRKRTAKENLELILTANSNLLEKLIPTLENFQIAFEPEQKAKKLEDFEAGVKMIFNSFKDVLEESGLEEINPEGEEFDPVFHEAMLEQYHDIVEEGHVVQVYQKGYKVKSKILKHAKVITSKGKEPKSEKKKKGD
jgi:molecular chaperone GrpE